VVLRASAEISGKELNLRAIVDRDVSIGDASGDLLLAFADAVVGTDNAALAAIQQRVLDTLGAEALRSAAAVGANFSRNDRIANGIGIPLEREFVTQGADLRALLDLDRFLSARNSLG